VALPRAGIALRIFGRTGDGYVQQLKNKKSARVHLNSGALYLTKPETSTSDHVSKDKNLEISKIFIYNIFTFQIHAVETIPNRNDHTVMMKSFELDPITIGGRINRMRNRHNYSIEQLADLAGLNKNTVNRITKGIGKPNLNTFLKLCHALKVTPNDLMESHIDQNAPYRIIRPTDTQNLTFHAQESGIRIGQLLNKLPQSTMSCMLIEVSQQTSTRTHVGEECLICLSGRIGLTIGEKNIEIAPCETVVFHASEPHSYYNADTKQKTSTALSALSDAALEESSKHLLSDQ